MMHASEWRSATLQWWPTTLQWWPTSQRTDIVPFLIIAGIALAAFLLFQAIKYIRGPSAKKAITGAFSTMAFRRAARAAGLGDEDAAFIETYAKRSGISNPEYLFRNEDKLDSFFKSVFSKLERESDSESVTEANKARLFAIRELIDAARSDRDVVTSTQELARRTPLSFVTPRDENYPSLVLAVEPGGLAVEPARDEYGEIKRFVPLTKLTFFFYTRNQQGFRFTTRVKGYAKVDGKPAMVIGHSNSVIALPSRQHARRDMNAPCRFSRVDMISDGAKKAASYTAVAGKTAYPGVLVDVSAGGCSIRTAAPLSPGDYLKIEFASNNRMHAIYGQVLRFARIGTRGGTMHIRFVKGSRKTLNDIMAFVYDYAD
jgi:hypothetical protein